MATTLNVTTLSIIPKGTPTPIKVTSPSQLRTLRLAYSENLARDIENLSQTVSGLHTRLANTAPAVTQITLRDSKTGIAVPLADALSPFTGDQGFGGKTGTVPAPAAGDAAANKYLRADGTWASVPGVAGILSGAGAPSAILGSNGAIYLDTAATVLYGPKNAGVWPAGVSLIGPSGDTVIEVNSAPVGLAGVAGPLVIGFVIGNGAPGLNVGPMLLAPHAGSLVRCKVLVKTSDPALPLTFAIIRNGVSVFSSSPSFASGAASGTVRTFAALTSTPMSIAADDVFSIDISAGSSAWQFAAQLE